MPFWADPICSMRLLVFDPSSARVMLRSAVDLEEEEEEAGALEGIGADLRMGPPGTAAAAAASPVTFLMDSWEGPFGLVIAVGCFILIDGVVLLLLVVVTPVTSIATGADLAWSARTAADDTTGCGWLLIVVVVVTDSILTAASGVAVLVGLVLALVLAEEVSIEARRGGAVEKEEAIVIKQY